jgi:hypothetical protein
MKRCKGKDMLIKHHITRDIHAPILGIKEFIAFVKRTIDNENTLLGTEG